VAVWDDAAVAAGIEAQGRLLQGSLDAGAALVGWKIGFGSPAAMEQLGIEAPLVGFVVSVLDPGSTVSLRGWTKPAFEPEIAIHIDRDLGPGSSRDEAAAAIGALGPAIEVVDIDGPLDDVASIVGGNIFQRHVVFGPADTSRRGGDAGGIDVQVLCNGAEVGATTDPEAFVGDFVDLTVHTADWLAAAGQALRAGHKIMAGSVMPLLWPQPGDRFEYRCNPIGTLEVTFSG
jgi:2-keto-4-pentenoate hydratase